MDSQDLVDRGTILRATVGSTLHGLHHSAQDDRDEMAVFVEPPSTWWDRACPRTGTERTAARDTRPEARQPAGAHRGSRLRHEVRHARRSAWLTGHRAR